MNRKEAERRAEDWFDKHSDSSAGLQVWGFADELWRAYTEGMEAAAEIAYLESIKGELTHVERDAIFRTERAIRQAAQEEKP